MPYSWFLNREHEYTRGTKIFLWKLRVTVAPQRWVGGLTKGSPKATTTAYATKAEAEAAYEAQCRKIEALGWHVRVREFAGATATKRATPSATERELEAISVELARTLRQAGSDARAARAALTHAIARYRKARTAAGEPAEEFAMHFFAVDGVGLAKARKPALSRTGATSAQVARWTAMLEKLVGTKARPRARVLRSVPDG